MQDGHVRRIEHHEITGGLTRSARAVALFDANRIVKLPTHLSAALLIDARIAFRPQKIGLRLRAGRLCIRHNAAQLVCRRALGDFQFPRLRVAPTGRLAGGMDNGPNGRIRYGFGQERAAGKPGRHQSIELGICLVHPAVASLMAATYPMAAAKAAIASTAIRIFPQDHGRSPLTLPLRPLTTNR